jgi:hypothetical protein
VWRGGSLHWGTRFTSRALPEADWTPTAGYEWMKYSGHFGSVGDAAPAISLFGAVVWINGQGPESPSARAVFEFGPPGYPFAGGNAPSG